MIKVKGRPRDGYSGIEVSVDRAEQEEHAEIDVNVLDIYRVEDLSLGLSDVTLRGKVLDTDPVRTFNRDDGSEGKVSNLSVGDETGRVRVTLWDERADRADEIEVGANVEIVDGYTRDRDGDLELHVGSRGDVHEIDEEVEYVPDATAIDALEIGQTVDISGVVRSADPVRTFERNDGSDGQVRNIRVQDETGDVRVALWSEKADAEIAPGDEILLADVEIQDGWQDDLEASAGWRSTVTVLSDGGASASTGQQSATRGAGHSSGKREAGAGDSSSGETGLGAFSGASSSSGGSSSGETERGGAHTSSSGAEKDSSDEPIEFTGMVVQTGDPVILDSNGETMTVETDATVQLGQEVTVRGRLVGDRLNADEVF